MKKYKVGLVIGRFQPFHKGHAYVLKKALEKSEKIIIGIGSSNKINRDNPISYSSRKGLLERFILREELQDKVIKIVAIPDIPDDSKWLQIVLRKIKQFDVVFGNNAWVNNIFMNAGYKVIRVPYYRRDALEGEKIRKRIRSEAKWENRVPSYLIKPIRKEFNIE